MTMERLPPFRGLIFALVCGVGTVAAVSSYQPYVRRYHRRKERTP